MERKEFINGNPKGAIQIIHGMREHKERYMEVAEKFFNEGYSVYLSDHPGHGENRDLSKFKENFFEEALKKQLEYSEKIKRDIGEKPLFILGHSMGSFILQKYMQNKNPATGYMLSGSCGKRILPKIGYFALNIYLNLFQDRYSKKFEEIIFFGFDKKEKNDWLTREREIYSKVSSDPFWIECYPLSFYKDFFYMLKDLHKKEEVQKISRNNPILVFSGEMDPVGQMGYGVKRLYSQYKSIGCKDLELKIYPEGRHEMLNETNREEVLKDIIFWLEKHI